MNLEEFLAEREAKYAGIARDWGKDTSLGRETRETLKLIALVRELQDQRDKYTGISISPVETARELMRDNDKLLSIIEGRAE